MSRVKSPEERGPIGAWAYETRVERDVSVEQVIEALPTRYHPATLRKVESGSAQPGRRMLRELAAYYDSEPPGALQATETPESLVALVKLLLEEIRAERAARVEWERGFLEAMRELARATAPQADPEPAPPVVAHP